MKCAFDKICITPSLPDRLSGFGKMRVAEEVLDDLYARIFLFEDLLWVQFDLVGVGEELLELIKEKTAMDKVLLSATHTHSGVDGTLNTKDGPLKGLDVIFGDYNPDYNEWIAEKIQKKVIELKDSLKEAQVKVVKTKLYGLGTDRHDEVKDADYDALALIFKADEDEAMILRAACHPTVMNAANIKVSADYCGAIEKEFEEFKLVAFVNGSAGDMSTRFTRQNSDPSELVRYGKLVKEALVQDIEKAEYKDFSLEFEAKEFNVAVRDTDPIDVAKQKVEDAKKAFLEAKEKGLDAKELRVIESILEGAENNLLCSYTLKGVSYLPLKVELLKINDEVLIFTPLELFSKLSNPIKAEMGCEFVGYTNGYYLYCPDEEAYELSYYEAGSSPFKKGAGEQFMQDIKEWMKIA